MTRTFSYIGDDGLEVSFDITTQGQEDAVVRAFFVYQRDQRRAYRDLDTGAPHPSTGQLNDMRDYLRDASFPASMVGVLDIIRVQAKDLAEEVAAFETARAAFERTGTGSVASIRAHLELRRERPGERFQVRVTVPYIFFDLKKMFEVVSVAQDYLALGKGME